MGDYAEQRLYDGQFDLMPYASDAQRRFFHSEGAAKAGITPKEVEEFDSESKGKSLPERSGKLKAMKTLAESKK